MKRRAGLWLCLLALGCEPIPSALQWEVDFADDARGRDVRRVVIYISRDGCGGERLYEEVIVRSTVATNPPPELEPGTYGFGAEGDDESCRIIMRDCQDREVPDPTRLSLRLEETAPEARCEAAACAGGVCG